MNNIMTRMAELTDIQRVAQLFDSYRQFYQQESNIERATDFIQQRMENRESVILVAVEPNNEIVGFCQLYPSFCSVIAAPIYVLYDLFILPGKRRSGAGKKLLLAAEDAAKQAGVRRMDLTTARSNISAQNLYESLGWQADTVFIAYTKNIAAE
jgi:ribosomal protein S18 acetylase RimI-like enzyme